MNGTLRKLKAPMLRLLRTRYPEKEVQLRWIRIGNQVRLWIAEDGDLGGRANMMSSNILLCYAVCAFYEAMDRNLSQEEFDSLVQESMAGSFRMMNLLDVNRLVRSPRLIRMLYACLEHYKKKVDRYRGNRWGNTWKIRINPEGHTTGFAMTLDSCPLFEFCEKHGYLEILPWMCAVDHVTARAMHAALIRHQTISSGDPCCAYWYVGDRSPEALADSGSK